MNLTTAQQYDRDEQQIFSLHQLAKTISAGIPLDEALVEAIGFVSSLTKCDVCSIYLRDGNDLVLRASKNNRPNTFEKVRSKISGGAKVWLGSGLSMEVVPSSKTQGSVKRYSCAVRENELKSMLTVPMVCDGRFVGVIVVQNRNRHWYEEHEIGWMKSLGVFLGIEIERSRLEGENLQWKQKMRDRIIFERAKKILQSTLKMSEEDAYLTLQLDSKRWRKPMIEIAKAINLTEDLKQSYHRSSDSAPRAAGECLANHSGK